MTSLTPLVGTELVDCARANAKQGIQTAAKLCGYGDDLNRFAQELRKACQEMNLQVKELSDLITDQDMILQIGVGEIVAPEDTPGVL
jgi:ATP-dependent protease HslVU (ClpYQ) peptidase subunit